MDYAQSEIFHLLLKHLLKEKIEFATIAEKINNKSKSIQVEPINLETDSVKQDNSLVTCRSSIRKKLTNTQMSSQRKWRMSEKMNEEDEGYGDDIADFIKAFIKFLRA